MQVKRTLEAPTVSGFTFGSSRGIIGHAHPYPPQKQMARPSATCVGSLRAGFQHGFLPGVERAVATVLFEIGLSAFGEKIAPCDLESTTGLVEGLGAAPCMFCWMAPRIEAANPRPPCLPSRECGCAAPHDRSAPRWCVAGGSEQSDGRPGEHGAAERTAIGQGSGAGPDRDC